MKSSPIRRAGWVLFSLSALFCTAGAASAEDEAAEIAIIESDEVSKQEEPKVHATFAHGYPVRFARRPLVLDEGMVRADGRLTVGGVLPFRLWTSEERSAQSRTSRSA